jgi:hypothetical protein
MNRKTILIIGSILGVLLCCAAIAVWGIYSFVNNPSVKEGFQIAGDELQAMLELRQKVAQTYPCEEVGIQIMNGNTLNVSLVNSQFNDLSTAEQADKAREVAKFVKTNYTGKANVVRIVIIFVKNAKVGPVNTNSSFSYPFDISELE